MHGQPHVRFAEGILFQDVDFILMSP